MKAVLGEDGKGRERGVEVGGCRAAMKAVLGEDGKTMAGYDRQLFGSLTPQ